MPIHDWTRVEAGTFHMFHQGWTFQIAGSLNRGLLPSGYYTMSEQIAGQFGPDVLTLHGPVGNGKPTAEESTGGGVALAVAPPRARFHLSAANRYVDKSVTVRHSSDDRVVALIEVVSPGKKSSRTRWNAFVEKAKSVLAAGIHLLVVDLFPPNSRDPQGTHHAIWGEDENDDYSPPENKRLTCMSYVGGFNAHAFIEPVAVGDVLPDMPLFLSLDEYVSIPLESTYASTWDLMPMRYREILTQPIRS